MLLDECRRAGVTIRLDCETQSVRRNDAFILETGAGRFRSDSLVVATGGLSIPALGGSPFGYRLADQFGLALLPTSPGLVPFTFSGDLNDRFSRLSGVSCEATVSTVRASFREDLLFTHRGLSGPAVLQADPAGDGHRRAGVLAQHPHLPRRSRALPSGSPPPTRAEIVISLMTFVNNFPRLAS